MTDRRSAVVGTLSRLLSGVMSGRGMHFAFAQTAATQVAIVLLNLVTGLVTARLLGPSGRGEFVAITLWPMLLSSIALGGLPTALVYSARSDAADAPRVFGAATLLGLLLALLACAAGWFLVPWAMGGQYSAEVVAIARVGTVMAGVFLFSSLIKQSFTAIDRIGVFNTANWADPALYLVLLLLMALTAPLTPLTATLCLWGASLALQVWMIWKLLTIQSIRLSGTGTWIRKLASYTLRASGNGALGSLASYVDRLALVAMLPPRELGYYAVAFSLSRLLLILQTGVTAVLLPAMVGMRRAGIAELHDQAFGWMLGAVVLAIAVCWPVSGYLLTVVYGVEFLPTRSLFLILLVEAGLACLCQVTCQLYFALGRPTFVSVAQTISFAVAIGGLLILIPEYGTMGAALGMTLAGVSRLMILLIGLPGVLSLPLPRPWRITSDLSDFARRVRRA